MPTVSRQIEATDHEIDRLVYELYGLSEEEIRIVEEATKPQASGGCQPAGSSR